MSPEIITFDKSLDKRFEEYSEIFLDSQRQTPISSEDVFSEWCYYIEIAIEPIGWYALWKINRDTCEKFSIPFPTVVFVIVNKIHFEKLSAEVEIIAVKDDDTNIPEIHEVPLTNLYPTKDQENVVNAYETANIIDKLRFFYDFIWQPWDRDDDSEDWPCVHLFNRISLLKDIQNGSRQLRLKLHSLIEEGRQLFARIQKLEPNAQDDNEKDEMLNDLDESKAFQLMELQLALKQVKEHFQVLENPVLRGLNEKNKQLFNEQSSNDPSIVWLGGPIDELTEFLDKIKNITGNICINTFSNISDALKNAHLNQHILLCPGIHQLNDIEGFENNVTITGINLEKCILQLNPLASKAMSYVQNGTLTLKNLIIDASKRVTSLRIKNSLLVLNSCRILGSIGIDTFVLLSGKLNANDCEFSDARTAIVVLQESKINITKSKISNCRVGLFASEKSPVSLNDTIICNCAEYGIHFETNDEKSEETESKIGSIELLENLPEFDLKNVNLNTNHNGDVLLHRKSNFLNEIAAADSSFEEMSRSFTY